MRRFCSKLHLWLSVPFGLIVTIVCLTGAVLVFEQQIMERVQPELYFARKAQGEKLPVDRVAAIVARSLPDSIGVTGVTIASDPRRNWQVSLSQPRRTSVFVDPYTGEITGRNERAAFFTCMFRMHRWLLDSPKSGGGISWGKLIVGISTLLFVIVLLTGVVIWVPRTREVLRNRLRIATRKGWRRFWYDLHVTAGIYATVLLFVMALTGLTWSFSWYRNGFYGLFGARTEAATHAKPGIVEQADQKQGSGKQGHGLQGGRRTDGGHRERQDGKFLHWDGVCDQLMAGNPDYLRITVGDGTASVSRRQWGNQRAADSYRFDSRSGEITECVRYEDAARSSKLRGWIYSLHVGNWGGLPSRIITFLAALIGATLPMTGYYLWLRRMARKKGNNHH